MPTKVGQLMNRDPVTLESSAPLIHAAQIMRQEDVGSVMVVNDGEEVVGILTDRDIVVRGLVDGNNPATTLVGDVCSKQLNVLKPNSTVEEAVQLMRENSVRRLPVMDNGKVVGVISIGDLALERDEKSALASISAAPANH